MSVPKEGYFFFSQQHENKITESHGERQYPIKRNFCLVDGVIVQYNYWSENPEVAKANLSLFPDAVFIGKGVHSHAEI
jgi:hypothetical protein